MFWLQENLIRWKKCQRNVQLVFNLCSTEQSCIHIGITCYKISTLMIKYVTFESSSQVQSKTRRLVKFLLELIVKPLAAAFEIFNSVELTFEFRLHSKSHRLNCGHRARNKIKLKRTCILTRFMFLTEQKKLC